MCSSNEKKFITTRKYSFNILVNNISLTVYLPFVWHEMVGPYHRLPLHHERVFVAVHDHRNMVLIFVTVNLEYVGFDLPTSHHNVAAVTSDEHSSTSNGVCRLLPKSEEFAFQAYQMLLFLDPMHIHRMCHVLYRNHASYCTRSTPFGRREFRLLKRTTASK